MTNLNVAWQTSTTVSALIGRSSSPVLLRHYVIRKGLVGILSPVGGSYRFHPCRASTLVTVSTAICAQCTLRVGYAGVITGWGEPNLRPLFMLVSEKKRLVLVLTWVGSRS